MGKHRLVLGVVVLFLLTLTLRAAADPVTADFDVRVTFAHGDFETSFFFEPIRPGDLLHLNLLYDPTGIPDSPNPLIGRYSPRGALGIFGAAAGFASPLGQITVTDDRFDGVPDGHDTFTASIGNTPFPGFELVDASLELDSSAAGGGSGLPRSTDELLVRFNRGRFAFIAFPPEQEDPSHVILGDAFPSGAAQTPEPASLLLLGSGLSMLMFRGRRRQG